MMVAKCRFSHSVCPSICVGLLLRGMPFLHPIHHSFLPLQQHRVDSASSVLRTLCMGSYPRLWLRRLRLWVAPCGVLPCGPRALPCLARQDVAGLCRASLGSPGRGGVWEPGPGLSWAQGPQPHDPSAEEAASESGRASSPASLRVHVHLLSSVTEGLSSELCVQDALGSVPAVPLMGFGRTLSSFVVLCTPC